MAFIVALGCAYAGAASTVNYDLLGRKGSIFPFDNELYLQ